LSSLLHYSVFLTFYVLIIASATLDAETMEIHHSKHHNAYVTNLNVALEKLDAAVSSSDVSGIIAVQSALKFNGGGHVNHTLFWENLTPPGTSSLNDGALKTVICASFGDVEKLKADMSATTVAVQGSGWGWLGYNVKSGKCNRFFVMGFYSSRLSGSHDLSYVLKCSLTHVT
jgi:superoxide dismutase